MKIDVKRLEALAKTGERQTEIARVLGVKPNSVFVALRRWGFLQVWRDQRFA